VFTIEGWDGLSDLSSLDTISNKTSCRVRSREPMFATKSTSVCSLQEAGVIMRLLFDWEYGVPDRTVCCTDALSAKTLLG